MSDVAMPATAPWPEPTRRVDMVYAGSAPQRRLTVAFRIILVIPQIVVLYFLSLALYIVVIIGWFGALFMGRLPNWVHEFASGVVRWITRVGGYLFLLTDRYPRFSLDDEDYPVRPILPRPGRLNRWAVFFRVVLAVPAWIFLSIVNYGLTVPLLFVAWLITLVSGRMPDSLYWAYAALLRYQTRLTSWFVMLTSEYPWGMLGDRGVPVSAAGSPPQPWSPPTGPQSYASGSPAAPAPSPPPPGYGPSQLPPPPPPGYGAPTPPAPPSGSPIPPPGYGAPTPPPLPPPPGYGVVPASPPPLPPPAYGAPMPPPSERFAVAPGGSEELPQWSRLVLTGAARGWMIFAIVWGSVLFVGQAVVQNAAVSHRNAAVLQANSVTDGYNATYDQLRKAVGNGSNGTLDTCPTLSCLQSASQGVADSLAKFSDDLSTTSFPAQATASSQRVESDVSQLHAFFKSLADASSIQQIRALAQHSQIDAILQSYPGDVRSLINDIDGS